MGSSPSTCTRDWSGCALAPDVREFESRRRAAFRRGHQNPLADVQSRTLTTEPRFEQPLHGLDPRPLRFELRELALGQLPPARRRWSLPVEPRDEFARLGDGEPRSQRDLDQLEAPDCVEAVAALF